ncbi:hypothetical protein NEUTE2DRAFT_160762 [Neurospora tetrasperma FGSC 2509]|nr:hypothetical protein NEUTE2DRAFT_160762 [Neurospora tetrasperma FGSC 2509]
MGYGSGLAVAGGELGHWRSLSGWQSRLDAVRIVKDTVTGVCCRCGYPVVDATEKERQASTLAVLVLVGALESGGDVYFFDDGTLFELICTSFDRPDPEKCQFILGDGLPLQWNSRALMCTARRL